jgi:hypothetical protein
MHITRLSLGGSKKYKFILTLSRVTSIVLSKRPSRPRPLSPLVCLIRLPRRLRDIVIMHPILQPHVQERIRVSVKCVVFSELSVPLLLIRAILIHQDLSIFQCAFSNLETPLLPQILENSEDIWYLIQIVDVIE